MYNLKTIELKHSLYEVVPILLFLWGSVLACIVKLLPQVFVYIFLFIAIISSVIIIFHYRLKKPLGYLSILNNRAWLVTSHGRFLIEFKHYNNWRLLGDLTIDTDAESLKLNNSILIRLIQEKLFASRKVLSIYHTGVNKEYFNYLRSFAAYQCFTKQRNSDSY